MYLLMVREENLGQKDQEVDVTGISVLLSNIQLAVLKFACKIYHQLLGKYQSGQVSFHILYVFSEDIRRNFTLSLCKRLAPSLVQFATTQADRSKQNISGKMPLREQQLTNSQSVVLLLRFCER